MLGSNPKFSEGVVASKSGWQDDPRSLQISAQVQPGSSASPLFDGDGNIIGVVVATLDAAKVYQAASAIPQNVNLAINADYLLSLVAASERFSWVADYWRSHRKRRHNARRLSALGDVRWWD